jgi:hypothetical protein
MGLAIDDDGNFYISEILPATPLLRLDSVTGATPAPGHAQLAARLGAHPHAPHASGHAGFRQSPVTAFGEGTVDTDGDGSPDGDLVHDQLPDRGQHGPHEAEYTVETDFYRPTAAVNLKLNPSTGSPRSGVITDGH